MSSVKFIKDHLSPDEFELVEGNLLDILLDKYDHFPTHARIYADSVSQLTDITPKGKLGEDGTIIVSEGEIDKLKAFDGEAIVVEYPADFGQLILFAISFFATALLAPKPPEIQRNTTRLNNANVSSGTNQLSGRSNRARPFARIPDIYGKLRVTPDLIGLPLITYDRGVQQETTTFCIGRGEYDIEDIREGETAASSIPDLSLSIHGPDASLDALSPPQLSVGTRYAPFSIVRQINGVNGQVLEAPNARSKHYSATVVRFSDDPPGGGSGGNIVISIGLAGSGQVSVGDSVYVDIPWSVGHGRGTFRGTYTVTAIDPLRPAHLTLNVVYGERGFNSGTGTAIVVDSNVFPRWVGPFDFVESSDGRGQNVSINVVAPRGLYFDGVRQDFNLALDIILEVAFFNADGSRFTDRFGRISYETTARMTGIAGDTARIGATLFSGTASPLRGRFRVARNTNIQYSTAWQENSEVLLESAYVLSPYRASDSFGDCTWGIATVPANPSSVVIRDRKLNMIATRKLPVIGSDGGVPTIISPTTRAIDAILAMTVDNRIGRRTEDSININNLKDINAEILEYFGNDKMIEFSAAFDDSSQSYEDMVQTVAQTLLCTPYRRGGRLNLLFNKLNRPARLLFNHRNKEPGSETRTIQWGSANDRDGVELTYTDPVTDLPSTLSIPATGIINPLKVDGVGIRSVEQARVHANRIRNRQLHENVVVAFNATEEAALLINNDIVICADNTRPETQDGEVLAVNGLVLTLSQPVIMETGVVYSIFLQGDRGVVESIPITAGTVDTQINLTRVPKRPLVVDLESYARTTYQIVKADDSGLSRFLLTERGTSDNGLYSIQAVNDSPKFYANDQDVRVTT